MEILLALGLGIGLSSVAGVRAFVPLALGALFAAAGLYVAPFVEVGGDGWWWSAFGVLAGLAVVEIVLDKIPALDRAFNYAMVPVRAFAGAVVFTAALGFDLDTGSLPWLVVGALIAGAVAVAKVLLRPPAKAVSAGVSPIFLSFFEDVVGLVGSAVGLFVPLVPLVLVAFLLFFFYRVGRRRGRKFEGLRILGD
ncbi:MAG TPA: DUF4126 domain-containing protein [Rubrobacteraceae bacterium]|nr:DUF4126 domain-containing protein [Rubrobacteraceae bacterium]